MTGITCHLPTPYDGPDPQREATAITEAAKTSFGAGMNILPKERRDGIHAVYAFARQVDDIADGQFTPDEKHRALGQWRDEIESLYKGKPRSAVGRALLPAVRSYLLPKDEFLSLVDGMAMDADGPIRAPSRQELSLYTRRVAGTVGVLSIRIFGAWISDVSDRFALHLGDALQLTNILRDVEEDARIGRLYLPEELLARHGLEGASPSVVASAEALPVMRAELGTEAQAEYDAARALAPLHDRKALRPALMMMGAYEGYLLRMRQLSWRLDPQKPLLSKREKLLRGLRYGFFGPGRVAVS